MQNQLKCIEMKNRRIDSNIQNIRILKNNSVYRIGDLIFRSGLRWQIDRQTILKDPKYSQTLLNDFFTQFSITDQEVDLNQLKLIADNHFVQTPCDELLINLRCGDIVSPNCIYYYGKCNIFNPDRLINQISQIITSKIKKINIITAMHYGSDDLKLNRYFWTQEKHNKNIELLNNLFSKIYEQFGIPIYIDANNLNDLAFIDYQFLKLIHADNVILDIGGFSRIIQEIRNLKK